MTTAGRYAVIFKAFDLDDFVRRRLACVVDAAPAADVYLMIDETARSAGPIDVDRVIRYRESDLIAIGFSPVSQGSLFWYNCDYPLYYFQHLHPDYDFIVMVEYDAVPTGNLDDLVQACRDQSIDFIGEPITKPLDTYWWTSTMLRFYARDMIRPYLVCAAVFSAKAVRHLAACRLEQGRGYDVADAKQWPIGETFIGTELAQGDFVLRDLSSFGNLTRYDWWPPTHESELPDCAGDVFVHPVLIGRRYMKSLFKSSFISGMIVLVKVALAGGARALRRTTSRMKTTVGRSGHRSAGRRL
jgi:hypothetical protein